VPRSPTVLALTRNTGGFFHGELLTGLIREVSAAGGRVVVVQTRDPADDGTRMFPAPPLSPVAWGHADGVVVESLAVERRYLEAARAEGKAVVLASHYLEGFDAPSALPDNRGGVRAAVEHLIAHGHTRIGFVGPADQQDFRERHEAYRTTMAEHHLAAGDDLSFAVPTYSRGSGAAAAPMLLATPDRPTAVVTATDDNAMGLIEALAAAGVSVPDDVAVIGFDDVDEGSFTVPSLSSVGQRVDELGALAGRLVLRIINGDDVAPGAYTAPASSVATRGSCGCRLDLFDRREGRLAQPVRTSKDVLRAELCHALGTLLSAHSAPSTDPAEAIVSDVEDLLTGRAPLTDQAFHGLVRTLHHLVPDPEGLQRVAHRMSEYLQELVDADPGPDSPGAERLTALLAQLQMHGYAHRSRRLEAAALELNAVAEGMVRADPAQIRSLRWLSGTHIRAGVLALWDGPPEVGRLRVTGVHDPNGAIPHAVPEAMGVREFPPAGLIAAADSTAGEVCIVLPVRDSSHDWGLLAVLGVIDTTSLREAYYHWSQLLSSALVGEGLQQAVRASEERYSQVARAANDGLWELDVATGATYLSQRCRDLLGTAADTDADLNTWLTVVHPDDRAAVRRAIRTAVERAEIAVEIEHRVVAPDRDDRWLLLRGMGVAAEGGTGPTARRATRLVGSLSDIHPRKELEERLRHAALYDPVTELPNRRLFLERLAAAMAGVRRRPTTRYAVVFLDLDAFKQVNDSLGHLAGDELLRVVGQRLRADVRAVDTAARFGGDEFAVLLTDPIPDELLVIAARLQQRVSAPVLLGDQEVAITASIGIAASETGYREPEDVLRDADFAMYQAKGVHPGSASLFDPAIHERAAQRLQARVELFAALEGRQFVMHYQPIVSLAGSPVARFEALVRWQHPTRGLLLPDQFLPAMRGNASGVALCQWVLDEVCGQIAAWRAEHDHPFTVAVNLSHQDFWRDGLVDEIAGALDRHDVPASAVVVEVTEPVVSADLEAATGVIERLRARGLSVHLDDFGAGQSSLGILRTLPLDALKIAGSLVRELTADRTAALVRGVVTMAGALGLEVIAEWVETTEQAALLREMGCPSGQGWLYAPALPPQEAQALLGRVLEPVAEGYRRRG